MAVSLLAWRGWFLDDTDLRRDLWGALLQVANWVDLASGDSYADLVSTGQAAGSPLDHYWSLAIEEQFYWVWPLALLLLLRLRPAGRCWAFGGLAVTGALLAAGIAAGCRRRRRLLGDTGAAGRDPRRCGAGRRATPPPRALPRRPPDSSPRPG